MPGAVEVVGVYEVQSAPDALLIEIVVGVPPNELDVDGFTQEDPDRPKDSWQVPWMEQWLDESGENVVSEPFEAPPDDLATSRLVYPDGRGRLADSGPTAAASRCC